MRQRFIFYTTLVCFLILAGCEATNGLGKDVEKAGQKIQETVDKNR